MEPKEHMHHMRSAYQEAMKAYDEGEVPVGAVIVKGDFVIGRGYNRVESLIDCTAHAEIIALTAASTKLNSWRLEGCTIYVTLEPCVMCLGAIMQSRIDTIVYGVSDPRAGAVDSFYFRPEIERIYRRYPEVVSGIMREESKSILRTFFAQSRKKS